MKEAVSRMGFDKDIGKRLHGHAKLELFDAETKKLVQKVENDNLVTEALGRLVNLVAGTSSDIGNLVMPVATRALGGIMLFDGELEESASNCAFPTGVSLVGWGNRGVNTDNTKRGSLNALESGEIGGGYRSVWDFGTSQANGRICSAALTNQAANPFIGHADYAMHQPLGTDGLALWPYTTFYNDGEYAYGAGGSGSYTQSTDSSTGVTTYYHTITVSIYKERVPLEAYKVADAPGAADYPAELVTTRTFSITTTDGVLPQYNYPHYAAMNGHDGYLYFVFTNGSSSSSAGTTAYYFTMKYGDGSFDASGVTAVTLPGVAAARMCGTVSGGYMYLISYDRHSVYKVNLSNTADISQVALPAGFYFTATTASHLHAAISPCPGGGVHISTYTAAADGRSGYYDRYAGYISTGGAVTLDGAKHDTVVSAYAAHIIPRMVNKDYGHMLSYCYVGGSSGWDARSYCRPATNYLGTICNLSSPITKNASQTLKVTYELYDE